MKLLQHAWSDMLVLDHIHQRLHAGLPDETTLPNGQKFDLLSLALLGMPQVADQLHQVTARLQDLKVDTSEYICLKFLLLLNPGPFGAIRVLSDHSPLTPISSCLQRSEVSPTTSWSKTRTNRRNKRCTIIRCISIHS